MVTSALLVYPSSVNSGSYTKGLITKDLNYSLCPFIVKYKLKFTASFVQSSAIF